MNCRTKQYDGMSEREERMNPSREEREKESICIACRDRVEDGERE